MNIIEIKNITRKELPIYYRRLYTGLVVLELMNKNIESEIEFQIEHKPTGQTEINLNLTKTIDYPLVPLHKELKNFIGALDSTGKLPS